MGLPTGVLYLLARMKSRGRLPDPLLSLGEQDLYATYDEVRAIAAAHGLPRHELKPEQRRLAAGLYLRNSGLLHHHFLHADTAFRLLGYQGCASLDVAAAEGATLIHDLNEPIPADWRGQYGTVIDGGTLEHIFDVRAALSNVASLVRVGGDVVHVNPMANWINHGFFQISPCLLYDFYLLNGFTAGEAYFVTLEPIRRGEPVRVACCEAYAHNHSTYVCKTSQPVLFVANFTKQTEVFPPRVPTQGKYADRIPAPHSRAIKTVADPARPSLSSAK